jgi:hypothetical protein
MSTIEKREREMAQKAKAQQKRARKNERRRAAAKSFQEPRRNGIDLAVAEMRRRE